MEKGKGPTIMVLKGPFLLNGSYVCRPLRVLFFLRQPLGLWSLICFTCTVFFLKSSFDCFCRGCFHGIFLGPSSLSSWLQVAALAAPFESSKFSVDY